MSMLQGIGEQAIDKHDVPSAGNGRAGLREGAGCERFGTDAGKHGLPNELRSMLVFLSSWHSPYSSARAASRSLETRSPAGRSRSVSIAVPCTRAEGSDQSSQNDYRFSP
jgi:hypothetical protein